MYNEADGDKTTDTNKVTIHNVRGGCVSGGILLIAPPFATAAGFQFHNTLPEFCSSRLLFRL